jgi:hypothetical protein
MAAEVDMDRKAGVVRLARVNEETTAARIKGVWNMIRLFPSILFSLFLFLWLLDRVGTEWLLLYDNSRGREWNAMERSNKPSFQVMENKKDSVKGIQRLPNSVLGSPSVCMRHAWW